MKYLLFAFTAILLDVASCGSRHDYDDELNVSSSRVILESQKGASSELFVSSDLHWDITVYGEWLHVSPSSGNSDAKIVVTALSSNESPYERSCTIIISGGPIQREVIVIQRGKVSVNDKEDGT
jgi:hypothetical protein